MSDISGQLAAIKRTQEEKLTETASRNLSLPYINLLNYQIPDNVLALLTKEEAKEYQAVPYMKVAKTVQYATASPLNPEQEEFLKQKAEQANLVFKKNLCSQTSFQYGLRLYDLISQKAEQKIQQAKVQQMKDWANIIKTLEDVGREISKVSTTELIDLVLAGAVNLGASDIHIEPEAVGVKLRFRIDGVLNDVGMIAGGQYKALISRIKNLSKMKLDISDKPQDGRFGRPIAGHPVDIRVSTIPTAFGENAVMRLLIEDSQLLNLEDLGFNPENLKLIEEAISQPNGMIMNTGPTGSGKTTTLYAILTKLNKPAVKIVTIEDPIEYRIKGLEQTQVNPSVNYTFASALRSVVRQDPDIIMVGEIRDNETADIALHAAITGHLVLTTLHTNSATAAIPRLLNMGIQPYLLAGSVNLVIAQRLVRKICSACQGKGCPNCQGLGYKGRLPIIECLKPTKEFNDLIVKKATLEEFELKARQLGMKTMYEDGMEKVRQGLTSEEEIKRVTKV